MRQSEPSGSPENRRTAGSAGNGMSVDLLDLRNPRLSGEAREKLCWRYYYGVYKPAFPTADEAEDPTVWLPLLAPAPPDGKPYLYLLLAIPATDASETLDLSTASSLSSVGGIHGEFFPVSNTAFLTYLCVAPEVRRRGISELLLRKMVCILRNHAGGALIPIFAEAEDPRQLSDPASQETAYRRLTVLGRLGFREIPINYRQPALGPGKKPVDYLKFLVFSPGSPTTVKSSSVRAFMDEFYKALDAGEPDKAQIFNGLVADDIATVALDDPT
jgi:hypothetical protein